MIFTPKLALLTALCGCILMFVGDYIYNLPSIPENLKSYATMLVSAFVIYAFCYFIQKNGHKF